VIPESGGTESAVAAESAALPLPAAPERAARPSLWSAAVELVHDLAVAVVVCAFLVAFVAQAFRVQGTSMQPLLEDGQRIIVNKLAYRLGEMRRGDVVVFHYPRDPSVSFIKRIVGLPGDVVELRHGVVYVNGQLLREPYLAPAMRDNDSHAPREVEQGYYYVLGDHRSSSNDSRNWGQVPERYIYGKAFFRFWPLSRLGVVH
jgi:signal peptidase I